MDDNSTVRGIMKRSVMNLIALTCDQNPLRADNFNMQLHCIAEIRAYWVETKLLR